MQQLSDLDYDAIESAVMETARGRWFLSEYKKRNSGASTSTLLDAVSRLEKVVNTLNNGSYIAEQPQTAAPQDQKTKQPKEKSGLIAPKPFFSGKKSKQTTSTDTTKTVSVPEPAALNEENLKFFSNDEDLFSNDANDLLPDASPLEAAPVEAPQAAKDVKIEKPESANAETKLDNETVDISDRFKVFRTDPNDTPAPTTQNTQEAGSEQEAAPEQEIKTETPSSIKDQKASEPSLDELFGAAPADEPEKVEAAPVKETIEVATTKVETPVVPDPVMEATDDEKDRIVIIRGNSASNLDIPFGDDIFGDKEDKPTLS